MYRRTSLIHIFIIIILVFLVTPTGVRAEEESYLQGNDFGEEFPAGWNTENAFAAHNIEDGFVGEPHTIVQQDGLGEWYLYRTVELEAGTYDLEIEGFLNQLWEEPLEIQLLNEYDEVMWSDDLPISENMEVESYSTTIDIESDGATTIRIWHPGEDIEQWFTLTYIDITNFNEMFVSPLELLDSPSFKNGPGKSWELVNHVGHDITQGSHTRFDLPPALNWFEMKQEVNIAPGEYEITIRDWNYDLHEEATPHIALRPEIGTVKQIELPTDETGHFTFEFETTRTTTEVAIVMFGASQDDWFELSEINMQGEQFAPEGKVYLRYEIAFEDFDEDKGVTEGWIKPTIGDGQYVTKERMKEADIYYNDTRVVHFGALTQAGAELFEEYHFAIGSRWVLESQSDSRYAEWVVIDDHWAYGDSKGDFWLHTYAEDPTTRWDFPVKFELYLPEEEPDPDLVVPPIEEAEPRAPEAVIVLLSSIGMWNTPGLMIIFLFSTLAVNILMAMIPAKLPMMAYIIVNIVIVSLFMYLRFVPLWGGITLVLGMAVMILFLFRGGMNENVH